MDFLPSLFTNHSLPLLFLLSFLAATLLPIGSEWLLIVMVLQDFSIPKTVITATVGNYLGACTTYTIGVLGSQWIIKNILRIDETQLKRAGQLYRRYGTWSLFLSWLPLIGDPLCLLAGSFKTRFGLFSVLVLVGKFCRYAILALLAAQGTGG